MWNHAIYLCMSMICCCCWIGQIRHYRCGPFPAVAVTACILIRCVSSQTTGTAEMFRSLCLPNLDTNGLVYVYTVLLDADSDLGLIYISTNELSFEPLASRAKELVSRLNESKLLEQIEHELEEGPAAKQVTHNVQPLTSGFLVSDLAVPELWHFVFKSTSMQQIIVPDYSQPLAEQAPADRAWFCQRFYQSLHHKLDGRPECFVSTTAMAGIAVQHSKFTVYCLLSPMTSHTLAAQIVQQIVTRWLPTQKDRLFLLCQNTWF